MNFNDIINVIKDRLLNVLLQVDRWSVLILNTIAFNKRGQNVPLIDIKNQLL